MAAIIRGGRHPFSGLADGVDVCKYAFMRTTIMFDPALMRHAKARSAERGESLKALLTRALASELALPQTAAGRTRARLPLFGASTGTAVTLTNADLEQALTDADVEGLGVPARQSPGRARTRR